MDSKRDIVELLLSTVYAETRDNCVRCYCGTHQRINGIAICVNCEGRAVVILRPDRYLKVMSRLEHNLARKSLRDDKD